MLKEEDSKGSAKEILRPERECQYSRGPLDELYSLQHFFFDFLPQPTEPQYLPLKIGLYAFKNIVLLKEPRELVSVEGSDNMTPEPFLKIYENMDRGDNS